MGSDRYDTNVNLKFKDSKEEAEARRLDQDPRHQVREEDLLLKNSKVQITLRLDGDVLEAIKRTAEAKGLRYQTFLNAYLKRSFVDGSDDPVLLELVNDLLKRVEKLESAS